MFKQQAAQTEYLNSKNTGIHKSVIVNIIFLLAVATSMLFGYLSYRQINDLITANTWVSHTYQVIITTDSVLLSLTESEIAQRYYLITKEESFLEERNKNIIKLQESIKQLLYLTNDNLTRNQRSRSFSKLIDQRLDLFNQPIAMSDTLKYSKAVLDQGAALSDRIKNVAEEIKSVEFTLLSERNENVLAYKKFSSYFVIFGQLISTLFILFSFVLFNRELIKRIHSENERKKAESLLHSNLKGATDLIAAIDTDYRYVFLNEAYKRDIKHFYGKDIAIGMKLHEVLADIPDFKNKLIPTWQAALEGKEIFTNIEFTSEHEKSTYEIHANPVTNSDGEIIGAVHIDRNITKRIQEQQELHDYNEKLNVSIKELQKKNDQISKLIEMSDYMLACSSQDELSTVVIKFCQSMLPSIKGILYIMHPSKNYLEVKNSWGKPTAQEITFAPDKCWAIRRGRTHHITETQTELTCEHIKTINKHLAYLCVPLMAQNDIYGLFFLETEQGPAAFNEDVQLLINAIAELTALALANVRLRENLRYQSIRDPVTALYNRRYLEDYLLKQINQASRMKYKLAILLLDLDHFKKVNDTYGHEAGNLVIKEVGRILQQDIRMEDIASRYGGDEFVIVFYNIDVKTAKERASRIQKDIAMLQVRSNVENIGPIAISIGISIFPDHGATLEKLIETADKALYTAKNTGRNKIIIYGEET